MYSYVINYYVILFIYLIFVQELDILDDNFLIIFNYRYFFISFCIYDFRFSLFLVLVIIWIVVVLWILVIFLIITFVVRSIISFIILGRRSRRLGLLVICCCLLFRGIKIRCGRIAYRKCFGYLFSLCRISYQ
jgi:hypothetical protein